MQKNLKLPLRLLPHSAPQFFLLSVVEPHPDRLRYSPALLDEMPSNPFVAFRPLNPARDYIKSY